MERSFTENVFHRIKQVTYSVTHMDFVKTYPKRYTSDFTQKDLELCVKNLYEFRMGRKIDLNNVKTFNEKLNWLKCFYHDNRMTECADKVTAPNYFRTHTGLDETYIVRNLGVYNKHEDIDFDKLPDRFVLKSNWGSGKQIIVKDKSKINLEQVKQELLTWFDPKCNHYFNGFEYGYKNIVPKIVCEEFIDFDYKMEFFCFDGTPYYFWTVYNDKTDEVCANFYDAKTLKKLNVSQGYPNSNLTVEIPKEFTQMMEIASKLSKGFPFVRIDYFKTASSFKFSEMTFYHWCGFKPFVPERFDLEFGEKLILPDKMI